MTSNLSSSKGQQSLSISSNSASVSLTTVAPRNSTSSKRIQGKVCILNITIFKHNLSSSLFFSCDNLLKQTTEYTKGSALIPNYSAVQGSRDTAEMATLTVENPEDKTPLDPLPQQRYPMMGMQRMGQYPGFFPNGHFGAQEQREPSGIPTGVPRSMLGSNNEILVSNYDQFVPQIFVLLSFWKFF